MLNIYPSKDVEMNSHTLYITLTSDADNALAGFPLMEAYEGEEQAIAEESRDSDGNIVVAINLGYREDTTVAQEQFLDTSDYVIKYHISANAQ